MTATGKPLLTIAQAASLIREKALSPVELTAMCLQRIEQVDNRVNAFIEVAADSALQAARAAEAHIMQQGPLGPLHGIPVGLKDVFDISGMATTACSRQLSGNMPVHSAAVAERLMGAGAVMLGKTATHEFAFGGPSFDLPWPPARNPWNLQHFTGGSSSGSAAAVAAGMVLGSIGSDTSGSVRSPAALCGATGLKPTYGRISLYGCLPLAYSLDHAGLLAWTAEDCAMLLQATAGHDPRDAASSKRPVPDYTADLGVGLRGLRIGVIRHFFENDHPVSDANRSAIDAALSAFRDMGAQVRTVTLSPLADWGAAGFLILLAEGYAAHEAWMRNAPGKYGELMHDRIALGAFVTSADYIQALRRRRELVLELEQTMQDIDILVSAIQPGEAPRIDAVSKWGAFEAPSHGMPFNLSGSPAISLCCGFGEQGLPLAMQMAGRPFAEATLLRAAHQFQQATQWHSCRPDL